MSSEVARDSESDYAAELVSDTSPALDLERADQRETARERAAGTPGPPACAARAVSLREHQLSGDRGSPRRVAGQGEDRHPSRPRGAAGASSRAPMHSADLERLSDRALKRLPAPRAPQHVAAARPGGRARPGGASVVHARVGHLAGGMADSFARCASRRCSLARAMLMPMARGMRRMRQSPIAGRRARRGRGRRARRSSSAGRAGTTTSGDVDRVARLSLRRLSRTPLSSSR